MNTRSIFFITIAIAITLFSVASIFYCKALGLTGWDDFEDPTPATATPATLTTPTPPASSTPSIPATPTPAPATPTPATPTPPDITWVTIAGGTFTMGDAWGDGGSDELPTHTVTISSFKMQQTEVTFYQYDKCVSAGICDESSYNGDSSYDVPNKPVVGIDWQDATDFCVWVGGDLPTEAQWEYAAGGGSAHWKWSLDESTFTSSKYCCDKNSASSTCVVGSYSANSLGLYDMSGNVWEWCKDWYQSNYYTESGSSTDPVCNNDTSGSRVKRGGSWNNNSYVLRSAYRYYFYPTYSNYNLGFRCACSP